MCILVLSDSHGERLLLSKVLNGWGSAVDLVVFCGDGVSDIMSVATSIKVPILCVRGNNDYSTTKPRDIIFNTQNIAIAQESKSGASNHKIFITHGDRYGVRYGCDTLNTAATSNGCDIVLFGHTHNPFEARVRALADDANSQKGAGTCKSYVYIMNPGSLGYPRYGGRPSFALLNITDDAVYSSFYEWREGSFSPFSPQPFY